MFLLSDSTFLTDLSPVATDCCCRQDEPRNDTRMRLDYTTRVRSKSDNISVELIFTTKKSMKSSYPILYNIIIIIIVCSSPSLISFTNNWTSLPIHNYLNNTTDDQIFLIHKDLRCFWVVRLLPRTLYTPLLHMPPRDLLYLVISITADRIGGQIVREIGENQGGVPMKWINKVSSWC